MRLSELTSPPTYHVPDPTVLRRVQRVRARPGSAAVGPVRMPPAGTLSGRFDLSSEVTGYFAASTTTAVLESIARREAHEVSMALIGTRLELVVHTTSPLLLLDLRPFATKWPVLQSLRWSETQELAADALAAGFQGIVYRSAQHYGQDCFALFGGAMTGLRLLQKFPLVDPLTGRLHRAVHEALTHAKLPLTP